MKLGNDPASQLVLSGLERTVIAAVARSLGEAGSILDEQARRARVAMRSHSGVGFVTRLDVPHDAAPLPEAVAHRLTPVHATHPELSEPAEFLVQLKAGRLATIEAFCQQGVWPADDARFRIAPGR